MTFGALAGWQAWLLAGAVAAAAGALFLVRVRPPRVTVPSLLLWGRVLDESRERSLWERIRRAVSFVVTVALAIALAFAFARPAAATRAASTANAMRAPRLLIVIDSSWSMLARTRSGETRWERAIAEARRIAASAGAEVAVATTADGLVDGATADLPAVEAALDRMEPGGGSGSGWPRLSGATVHFVTDGALARALDRDVVVHSVYEAAPNAGITAFDVRPALDASAAGEAYLEIANFGPAQQVHLQVTRGGARVADRRLDLGAGEALRQVLALPRGGAQEVRVRLDAPNDALGADNEAFGWIQDAKPLAVTVVGPQTAWLTPIFGASVGLRATFVAPADYKPGDEDAVIFDRWVPASAPTKPALYIAPPAAAWLGPAPDRVEPKPQWTLTPAHPVLDGVDALTFSIDRARFYQPPAFAPLVRSVAGTPLIFAADAVGQPRAALLAFGPTDSNLASAQAFPVLIGNAVEWLARPPASTAHHTGRAPFDAAITRVTSPRGANVPLIAMPGQQLAMLRAPGLYGEEAGSTRGTFAVNIADPDVSNLSRTTVSAGQGALMVAGGLSPRPWWVYLVALAFAIALIEWWTWLRRITV